MTEDMLKRIEAEYTPKPLPHCPVCGSELEIGMMGEGRIEYHCSQAKPIEHKWGSPEEKEASLHRNQSTVIRTAYDIGDSSVVELVNEYRKLRNKAEVLAQRTGFPL